MNSKYQLKFSTISKIKNLLSHRIYNYISIFSILHIVRIFPVIVKCSPGLSFWLADTSKLAALRGSGAIEPLGNAKCCWSDEALYLGKNELFQYVFMYSFKLT
nr:hypothetical protein Y105C5A.o - Caenorhabditis elegans [Caenorhabditis elegans]